MAKSRIVISKRPIGKAGVTLGDVGLVVNSTAGIDFCYEGGYVFNIDVGSMPNPIDYEGAGVGVRCDDHGSCFEDYDRLVAIPIDEYLTNRAEFLRMQLGALDGQAIGRSCALIQNAGKLGRASPEL